MTKVNFVLGELMGEVSCAIESNYQEHCRIIQGSVWQIWNLHPDLLIQEYLQRNNAVSKVWMITLN